MSPIRVLAGFAVGLLMSGIACAQTAPVPPQRVPLIDTHYEVPAMPPPTPKHDVTETFFGTVVHDPYRWLEDADAPAVEQWIAAQNAYTEKVMDGFTDAKAIAKRVGELALTSAQQSHPEIVGHTLFYLRQTPPQPQAELVAQAWPNGTSRVLVDPDAMKGKPAITDYWPSPDGKYVAYGTAEGGNEETTIQFVEVATGKTLPDALPHAGGGTTPQALVWDANDRGVTYARLPLPGTVPESDLQFNAALCHHTLGTPADQDTLEFGKGLSRVAEYTLLGSADGQHAAALLHYGDGAPDAVYLRSGNGQWKLALSTEANVRAASEVNQGAAWDGDRLLVIAYQHAPRGKLLNLDAHGTAHELVPQGDWAMHSVAPVQGGFLITEVRGPDWRVQQYSQDGKFVRTVPLPKSGIGVGPIASSALSPQALITYAGWTIPSRWVEFDAAHGTLKTVFEVKPAADYSKVVTYRLDATSKDGTKIPVTVIAMKGVTPNGKRPAILYGYGGFGISMVPTYAASILAWVEAGGVYAIAALRGGGEEGEDWHRAGMREHKQAV
ncbi:MAG: prolyl oligopeptidase family serine peptidase, partial [Rhodanobacteraceae bacterium]